MSEVTKPILLDETGQAIVDALNGIKEKIQGGDSSGVASIMTEITWSDLKSLRDNGTLVKGMLYRIIDYKCTTIQEDTQSAGHQYDIIVTADSEDTLNENARAIQHEGDTYFANSNLAAWELKYCLDNDTARFGWADTENGKGVIYYMKDEFDNECPYDFKNIQYYRSYDDSTELFSVINEDSTGVPCYTFSNALTSTSTESEDMSMSKSNNVYWNVIKEYSETLCRFLNNICFFGNYCVTNTFMEDCKDNTFGCDCCENTFGVSCCENTFGIGFFCNTFGDYCCGNKFAEGCNKNTFGIECSNNVFGFGCSDNVFGDNCHGNVFGNECYENTFGRFCFNNTFGDYYIENTFGTGCRYNTLEKSYTATCEFKTDTAYVTLTTEGTTADGTPLKNIEVYPSMSGTWSAKTTITIPSDELNSTNTIIYA